MIIQADGIVRSYVPIKDIHFVLLVIRIEKGGVERFEQYGNKILNIDEKLVYYYKIKE